MKQNKLHITFLFLLMWSFFYAQQFTNFTTKDGLPSNHIYKITQDAKGFIWIATDKGLVKYNGSTFKTFTTKEGLATNDIWGALPTPDGKLWYLSKTSRLGYIENNIVYDFESEQKGEIFNPVFTSQIDNTIILTSSNKYHVLENNKWKLFKKNSNSGLSNYIIHPKVNGFITIPELHSVTIKDKFNKMLKTFDIGDLSKSSHTRGQITDSLMYLINNKQYFILNLNTLKSYKKTFINQIGIEHSKHTRIILVNNKLQITGTSFVGDLDKDFNIKNTFFTPKEINAHYGIRDKSGAIWLSTFTNGFYYFPIEKQNINYCLYNEKVRHVKSVNNKIIASVFNKGFYKYNQTTNKFLPYITKKGFCYSTAYIKPLNTEYYLTKLNISVIKNNKQSILDVSHDLRFVNEKPRQIIFYNNYLYTLGSGGLFKINTTNFNIEKEYWQDGINQLLIVNNQFLIATSGGLKQFKDEVFKTITFTNQEFNKSILNITKISDSEILLNTDGFGAYISNLKSIKQLPGSEFLIVNNAYIENKTIWLATESGILKYEQEDNNYKLKTVLATSDGLPSNSINSIVVNDKNLIVGTNRGVAILAKNKENKSQLLDVYFENAKYNNEALTSANFVFDYVDNNSLNISVSSLDFSENKSNFSYNYKLEPIQNKWTNTSTKTINFNDLQPGKYSFKIKSNGINNCLGFEIKPLWWQTLWFNILAILLSIFLITYVSRLLIKRSNFKKNQKLFEEKRLSQLQLKALRSQMYPHFVFNSLAAIQFYINNNQMEASEVYLVKFSKLIRQFFELSKQKEIHIEAEIKLLKNYLDIEKLRFKDKFDYLINLDANINLKTFKLPTMLLQPILENAINHGIFNKIENGMVIINFKFIRENQLKIEIIDDGVGFKNTKKQSSRKVKSSIVLKDRLWYLNQTRQWNVKYENRELNPNLFDKGNISTFIITKI